VALWSREERSQGFEGVHTVEGFEIVEAGGGGHVVCALVFGAVDLFDGGVFDGGVLKTARTSECCGDITKDDGSGGTGRMKKDVSIDGSGRLFMSFIVERGRLRCSSEGVAT